MIHAPRSLPMMRSRSCASGISRLETMAPVMENVFPGDVYTASRLCTSLNLSIDVNGFPNSARSQWISSEARYTPCRTQSSATRASSSSRHTRPVGFWGLQRIRSFTPCFICSSIRSKSIRYVPPSRISPQSATSRPVFCIMA